MPRDLARQRIVTDLMAANLPYTYFATNSKAARDAWAGLAGIRPERVGVIANGLSPDPQGRPATPSALPAIPASARVVGGVMRIAHVKDPLLWLETAALVTSVLPDVHFVLLGDGPYRRKMERAVRSKGLSHRVHLIGARPDGAGDAYGWMDVLLITSRSESLSNALLEAQFAGVSVVATDVGGMREGRLKGGSVKLAGSRDPHELARLVIDVLGGAPERAGSKGATDMSHSTDVMVRQVLEAYERATTEAGGR
jgi:glycosyltransferase involved in cell wall biosynthesis